MKNNSLNQMANDLQELALTTMRIFSEEFEKTEENKDDTRDYYLGILRRQAMLYLDLDTLFRNRKPEFMTAPSILLKAVINDFLHLLYLELHRDRDGEITRICAQGFNKGFLSLQQQAVINNNYYKGENKNYITSEQVEVSKEKFASDPANRKYFADMERFEFLPFLSIEEMAKNITHSPKIEEMRDRAIELWIEFSVFEQYTIFSTYIEMEDSLSKGDQMEHAFIYAYNSLYLIGKYLEERTSIPFRDNPVLKRRFGRIPL